MTFAAPALLLGLLALPVLWLLRRLRRTLPPVAIPSLLFLQDELEGRPPRRRLLDLDLVLALLGTLLLVLAAAGPAWVLRASGRSLRVVVSGGAPATAPRIRMQTEAVLSHIRDRLRAEDALRVLELPPGRQGDARRPEASDLVQLALAGPGAWRAVLSDRPPPAGLSPRVAWIEVGVPDARNVGIVRVTPFRRGGRGGIWVLLHAIRRERIGLRAGEGPRLDTEFEGYASLELEWQTPPGARSLDIRLVTSQDLPWRDDLEADDHVTLARSELTLKLDVPRAYQDVLLAALRAGMGDEGVRLATDDAMLHVTTSDAGAPSPGWRLLLQPTGEGAVAAPMAPDAWVPDRMVEDLSTVGVDLRYGVAPAAAEASWLLWRDDDTAWPVVSRKEKTIVFWPDPLAGAPSPSETPLWPLFVDNLRRLIMGTDLGADGWRVRGLLDIETSELGTRRTDLERVSAMLAGVPADIREECRPLGGPLAIAGLLLLIALWFRTRAVPTPLAAVPSDL